MSPRHDPGFTTLLEAAPDAMVISDAGGTVVQANAAAHRLFGYAPGDLAGHNVDELMPERFRASHTAMRAKYADDPHRRSIDESADLAGLRADGTEFPVEISLSPLELADGLHIIAALRDITDRRRTEEVGDQARRQEVVADLGREALAGREIEPLLALAAQRAAGVLQAPLAAAFVVAPDDPRCLVVTALHGAWPALALGDRLTVQGGLDRLGPHGELQPLLIGQGPGEDHLHYAREVEANGIASGVAMPMITGDRFLGALGVYHAVRRPFGAAEHQFLQAVANLLALAVDRDRREAELRQSEDRLKAVLDNSTAAIYLKDLEGRYVLVNDEFARIMDMTGEELTGRTDADLFEAAIAADLRRNDAQVLDRDGAVEVEELVPLEDGVHTYISLKFPLRDAQGAAYGTGGVSTDITDRVRSQAEQAQLEERLRQAERLESVGQLAGGIAHDFNNLLAVILNFAGFAAEQLPAGSPGAEDIAQVQEAARRAAELTRRLLIFSRRHAARVEVLDPNALVEDLERILSRTLGDHVLLESRRERGLRSVEADPGQLEQALMNLAVNARDAMPNGGTLTVSTANVVADAEFARSHGDPALTGPFVRIGVSDTGTGMDAETAARAFEPFFTTKPQGAGTGLGLATVYGFAKQAGGVVDLYSVPGRGTTVSIFLPAASSDGQAPAEDGPEPPPRGEGQVVLLVEDAPAVRSAARRILVDAGYAVVEAADGEEALATSTVQEGRADLVLTDVVMPGMSGRELAERLRARDPRLPVLYMSGYAGDVLRRQGAFEPGGFLDKPFTADSLLRAVAAELAVRR